MTVISEIEIIKKCSGSFENFINTINFPDMKEEVTKVMSVINSITQRRGWNCQYAGSVNKNTYLSGFSDLDVFVNTNGIVLTSDERFKIASEIAKNLELSNECYHFKPIAIGFEGPKLAFDVVFSDGYEGMDGEIVRPENSMFYNRADRQRAVKALKFLSFKNMKMFPKIQGLALERMVIFVSTQIADCEKLDSSGFLIFHQVLREFALANDTLSLTTKIERALRAPSKEYVWKLSNDCLNSWRESCRFFLASVFEVAMKSEKMNQESFERFFQLPAKISRKTMIAENDQVIFI